MYDGKYDLKYVQAIYCSTRDAKPPVGLDRVGLDSMYDVKYVHAIYCSTRDAKPPQEKLSHQLV